MKTYYVYIMASMKNGTLYTGMTDDLPRRVFEHKNHLVEGFTDKYNVTLLVYYEETNDVYQAYEREKKIKNRHRDYKKKLIEKANPNWRDLSSDIL